MFELPGGVRAPPPLPLLKYPKIHFAGKKINSMMLNIPFPLPLNTDLTNQNIPFDVVFTDQIMKALRQATHKGVQPPIFQETILLLSTLCIYREQSPILCLMEFIDGIFFAIPLLISFHCSAQENSSSGFLLDLNNVPRLRLSL